MNYSNAGFQWNGRCRLRSAIKNFDEAFRADIVVDKKVIVELKSVEQITEAHKKQVQTYLRLTGCKLGSLLNFGETLMKRGITRVVHGLKDD
jgi:GxxExxY protein